MKILNSFRRLVWWLNRAQAIVAGWIVLLIMAIATYGVIMRYLFNRPDLWSYPVSAYALCLVIFLAASYTLQTGGHVRVDFFVVFLPAPVQRATNALAGLITSGFLLLLLWQTWAVFLKTVERGTIDESTLGWPLAFVQWVLPLSALFLVVTHILMILTGPDTETHHDRT